MSLTIVWSEQALQQAEALLDYIARDNKAAADRLWERLQEATIPLAEHPYLFRPGRLPGTRELVVETNYMLVYRVLLDCVEIVGAVHTRQRYPHPD